MIICVVILSGFINCALATADKSDPTLYINATLDYAVSYCSGVHSCFSYLLHKVRSHLFDCFQENSYSKREDKTIENVIGGQIRLFSLYQPAFMTYNITVNSYFFILLHFTLFEMDVTTDNCIYSFLTLEEMHRTSWYNQSHWRFCGIKRPWKEILQSYMGRINVTRYNTLETFNLTIKYEIFAKQNVGALYSLFYVQSTIILKLGTHGSVIIDKLQFHNYFWKTQCTYGYVITFRSIKMCCSDGYVQVYDGDGIYHSLYKFMFINKTQVHILQTTTAYFSSLINMNLSKDTKLGTLSGVVLHILFHRSKLNISILHVGNPVTVNNNNTLLHTVYKFSNIEFPKLKVETKLFTGLTSEDCAFGGIAIISDRVKVGPLCTLSD